MRWRRSRERQCGEAWQESAWASGLGCTEPNSPTRRTSGESTRAPASWKTWRAGSAASDAGGESLVVSRGGCSGGRGRSEMGQRGVLRRNAWERVLTVLEPRRDCGAIAKKGSRTGYNAVMESLVARVFDFLERGVERFWSVGFVDGRRVYIYIRGCGFYVYRRRNGDSVVGQGRQGWGS